MTTEIAYLENDETIYLNNLVDANGAPINSATVSLTIFTLDDSEVVGDTWPAPMAYVSGSAGQYEYDRVAANVSLALNVDYKAKVKVVAGAFNMVLWKYFQAAERLG